MMRRKITIRKRIKSTIKIQRLGCSGVTDPYQPVERWARAIVRGGSPGILCVLALWSLGYDLVPSQPFSPAVS
jgi:hypothetical protein